jgi:hypothetical protein
MATKKPINLKGLTKEQRAAYDKLSKEQFFIEQGIGLNKLVEPLAEFNKADCETVIQGQNNAYIVLGRDRPNTLLRSAHREEKTAECIRRRTRDKIYSGEISSATPLNIPPGKRPARGPYGPKGYHGAGSIDIVVGRHSADHIQVKKYGNKEVPIEVDPDFIKDAARIYISQLTDIDDNFNIGGSWKDECGVTIDFPDPDKPESPPACKYSYTRSGIGIKADAVRIIGREGVKIVTGGDTKNSLGGPTGGGWPTGVGGIDLMAGNDDHDMHPLVKGGNLIAAFEKLVDNVNALNGIVDSFLKYQMRVNKAFATHTHISPFSYDPVNPIMTSVSQTAVIEGRKALINQLNKTKKSLVFNKINLNNFKSTFLNVAGEGYICSKYNKTN